MDALQGLLMHPRNGRAVVGDGNNHTCSLLSAAVLKVPCCCCCCITSLQMIARLGTAIDNPDSVYYWAARNGIPVFCPAITDGSIGDMLFFHSYKSPGLIVDVVGDIRAINDSAMRAAPRRTGMIILGGGAHPAVSET